MFDILFFEAEDIFFHFEVEIEKLAREV